MKDGIEGIEIDRNRASVGLQERSIPAHRIVRAHLASNSSLRMIGVFITSSDSGLELAIDGVGDESKKNRLKRLFN
ncbi:MAG TPA: hypothetical protein V6D28_21625 [Leptolyngbyaceae cyanobacterium]